MPAPVQISRRRRIVSRTAANGSQSRIYGCSFGIAVFEGIEQDDFNPNVAFEVGYMTALGKQVCLLKDKNLRGLHTDLIGKIYKTFDPLDAITTIPPELTKWMQDKKKSNAK